MSNSINVQEERRTRELNKKFQIKGAHERDITGFTRVLYVVLHIISGLSACYVVYNLHFTNKVQQLIFSVLAAVVFGLNEYFKAKKMEYFAGLKLMSNDAELDMPIREKAEDERPKAFLLVAVFWLVSICAIGYGGFEFGEQKEAFKFTATNYDETIKSNAEAAILQYKNAIAQQQSPRSIAILASQADAKAATWQTHQKQVDSDNKLNKTNAEDEGVFMGLIYLIIAAAFEFIIFFARSWHEAEEYDVMKSKNKAAKTAKNEAKQAENSSEKQQRKAETVHISQKDLNDIFSNDELKKQFAAFVTFNSVLHDQANGKQPLNGNGVKNH